MIGTVHGRHGLAMPALGLGTWRMGESRAVRRDEISALKLGLDHGITLIDTAELYGSGEAETIVAEAIAGRRDELFLVSKVLPQNASRGGTIAACEASLGRLDTGWIDLYLLHWPGPHPLEATFEAFDRLREQGKIRWFGVSNFDVPEMDESELTRRGKDVVCNQVLYNLERRGIERNLVPWCSQRGVVVMAYSPLEQGRLKRKDALERVARRHDAEPSQIAIAWTMRWDHVVAIPKATRPEHVRLNAAAADIVLTREDLDDLDRGYPRPARDVPLESL